MCILSKTHIYIYIIHYGVQFMICHGSSVYWNSVLGRFVIFDTGISGSGSKTQSDKGWFVLAIRNEVVPQGICNKLGSSYLSIVHL